MSNLIHNRIGTAKGFLRNAASKEVINGLSQACVAVATCIVFSGNGGCKQIAAVLKEFKDEAIGCLGDDDYIGFVVHDKALFVAEVGKGMRDVVRGHLLTLSWI